jgi:hypothetical protein
LFDHNVPAPLRRHLASHQVVLADEMGWGEFVPGPDPGIHAVLRDLAVENSHRGRRPRHPVDGRVKPEPYRMENCEPGS